MPYAIASNDVDCSPKNNVCRRESRTAPVNRGCRCRQSHCPNVGPCRVDATGAAGFAVRRGQRFCSRGKEDRRKRRSAAQPGYVPVSSAHEPASSTDFPHFLRILLSYLVNNGDNNHNSRPKNKGNRNSRNSPSKDRNHVGRNRRNKAGVHIQAINGAYGRVIPVI
jgi:hypothetical protein